MRLLRTLLAVAVLATLPVAALAAAEGGAPVPAVLDDARAKLAADDLPGAIAGLAPYVAGHRSDLAAGRLLGDLYFRVPDYRKAEAAWRGVLAVSPGDREAHNRLGSLYAVEDRIDDAIAEFQKSLPSVRGYEGLVMAHRRAGDLPAFLDRTAAAAERAPADRYAWAMLGRIRRATRDYAGALLAFEHVVALRPGSCDGLVDLANALVDASRVDDAIPPLRRCLAGDPRYYAAVVNLGEAFLEKNDPNAARPYLERALAIKPDGSEALVDLGYVADRRGDWKSAVAYYTRAMNADPLRPEAYIDLGYDYQEHRLYSLAEAALLKGLSVSGDDGRLHYLLGATYNIQGKIALARQQYQRAIDSDEPVVVRAARHELALLPPER